MPRYVVITGAVFGYEADKMARSFQTRVFFIPVGESPIRKNVTARKYLLARKAEKGEDIQSHMIELSADSVLREIPEKDKRINDIRLKLNR